MKHTRVPRTVHRNIWRLAIETSSIPSFHIFRSWIRNQIECRIEDRKKPNGPNRKSNRLRKKQNSTYLVPRWIITRADWCGAMFAQATNLLTKTTLPWKFNLPHAILDQTSLICKICTNINQPYLIWAAVLCRHVPPTKDQGYWDQQSNRPGRRYVYIHDVVVVVVVLVDVVVDALELLQRLSPAGQLK